MLGLSKMHLQVQASSKLVLARVYGRKRNARRQRGDAVSQKKKLQQYRPKQKESIVFVQDRAAGTVCSERLRGGDRRVRI
jgi:hypothetical protein